MDMATRHSGGRLCLGATQQSGSNSQNEGPPFLTFLDHIISTERVASTESRSCALSERWLDARRKMGSFEELPLLSS